MRGFYMKKFIKLMPIFSILIAFASCGNETDDSATHTSYCIVYFDSNGGSVIDSQTIEYGNSATIPLEPIKKGHIFLGWYYDNSVNMKFDFNTKITNNMTLYAMWKENVCHLIYESNGADSGSAPLQENCLADFDLKISSYNTLKKNNATFVCWNTTEDGTGVDYYANDNITINSDTKLYAKWFDNTSFLVPNYSESIIFVQSEDIFSALTDIHEKTYIVIVGKITSLKAMADASYIYLDLSNIVGLTTLESHAFANCEKLEGISLPNGLITIENYAFYDCFGIESIIIPASVKSIKYGAFAYCYNLSKIELPSDLQELERYAFDNCKKLKTVIIPHKVSIIDGLLFRDCISLETVIIPDGVTLIRWEAFYGCTALTTLSFPSSLINIEYGAFSKCTNLDNLILPDSIISLEDHLFFECSSLKNITLPCNLHSIKNSVFSRCTSLSDLFIPKGITRIGQYAFAGCSNLSIKFEDMESLWYYVNNESYKNGNILGYMLEKNSDNNGKLLSETYCQYFLYNSKD